MPIDFDDSNADYRLIKLSGRLDIAGTAEIDLEFSSLAAAKYDRVIVDLTRVNFLTSIAIRSIISNAKAQQQRGGKFVIFVGDNDTVAETLEMTGIGTLIPIFKGIAEAIHAVS